MKRPLAFKLMVDPKNVRRAVALITGDAMTDEELEKSFFDREPIELAPEEGEFELTTAFVGLMIAEDLEEKEGKKETPIQSSFERRLREMKDKDKI